MRYIESMKKADKMKGFTIIELMITLVVAAILLSVGVPSFIDMMKNNRLAAAANSLASSVSLARSEAIERGLRVKVCKSTNGTNCISAGNWENGWAVMVDQNNDDAADGGTPIRVYGELSGDVTIGVTDADDYLSFTGHGRSEQSRTLNLCDGRSGDFGWRLSLGPDGRLSVLGYKPSERVTCP